MEDDQSLDRVRIKRSGHMLSASLESSLGDSVVTDSELSLVSGIMFDQHDKLNERMETVEATVGRYLGIYFGNPRISGVSV